MNSLFFRGLDCFLAVLLLVLSSPVLLVVVLVGICDTGSPVFTQQRVGFRQRPFVLIKFRTMSIGTASVATHEVNASSVTRWGALLRKTKIDELPQLINVLKGEMSLVGPRPCLFTQVDLINEREKKGVFAVMPGITGLAQINSIDMSTPELLAEWDHRMISAFSLRDYFRYLFLTVCGRGSGDRVNSD